MIAGGETADYYDTNQYFCKDRVKFVHRPLFADVYSLVDLRHGEHGNVGIRVW